MQSIHCCANLFPKWNPGERCHLGRAFLAIREAPIQTSAVHQVAAEFVYQFRVRIRCASHVAGSPTPQARCSLALSRTASQRISRHSLHTPSVLLCMPELSTSVRGKACSRRLVVHEVSCHQQLRSVDSGGVVRYVLTQLVCHRWASLSRTCPSCRLLKTPLLCRNIFLSSFNWIVKDSWDRHCVIHRSR
ncbi:hypothetical protein FKP32DRAFT_1238162 [Trametes sanguinea]|nr:hypothetical protein FKP32DRAFT_1238162 [Trametes sanguinea]